MTDPAYTDEDLRTEAARQLGITVEDPDFVGISERMDGAFIDSTVVDPDPQQGTEPVTGTTWDQLSREDFDGAQRRIDDLISRAANVSEWAINLGADGLEPDGHTLQLGIDPGNGDQPRVRIHFAFAPDMAGADRDRFVMRLSKAIAENL
ncbi:hypothetical protein [Streptomyces sp. NBC_01794]|uniref:hypothetical protein n=1 Tax=Streptomyces sp. NBC_01794 TaxID=2975942 RepID=UPI003091DE73|nr:hypothetical protein OIE54_12240 [Streptomyces sp. NBC_01794]